MTQFKMTFSSAPHFDYRRRGRLRRAMAPYKVWVTRDDATTSWMLGRRPLYEKALPKRRRVN